MITHEEMITDERLYYKRATSRARAMYYPLLMITDDATDAQNVILPPVNQNVLLGRHTEPY